MKPVKFLAVAATFLFSFHQSVNAQSAPCFPDTNVYYNGNTAIEIVAADFNNDGNNDVVAALQNGGFVVLSGDGTGLFSTALFSSSASQNYIVAGNIDADANVDIAISNAAGVEIYLGNGDGTFGAALTLTLASPGRALELNDFNGDGNTDLVVLENNVEQVVFYPGNGNGTFGTPIIHTALAGGNQLSLISGYFNADGFLDLAVNNTTTGNISVFHGNGNGIFGADSVYTTDTYPYYLYKDDVNNDGYTDILTANLAPSTVSVLLGNVNGNFTLAGSFPTGTNPTEVAVADFNGDGNLDLTTISLAGNVLSVLMGDGTGSYGSAYNYSVNAQGVSVRTADFTGDGRIDIVVGHLANGGITFLNNSIPLVGITASPSTSLCAGDAVALSSYGADLFAWSNGITDGVSFVPAITRTYYVTGTDSVSGCSNSDSILIIVNPLPIIGIGVVPFDTVCAGTTVTLSGNGGVSYVFDNGVMDGVPFVPTATNTFFVTGTDANGCTNVNSLQVVVDLCTGLKDGVASNSVTLYPNPASSFVQLSNLQNGDVITITDLLGNNLFSAKSESADLRIETGSFSNGIYLVKQLRADHLTGTKLVISK